MKSMISNLNDNASVEILFGAYMNADLQRLRDKGDLNYSNKLDARSLIFRVPSETGAGLMVYDIVSICPPPNSCESN